jgi:hypothetical protein
MKNIKRIEQNALAEESPATIFDLTRHAAEAVQSDYDGILNRIRDSPILYVDETGIHVQGEKHWIWTFITPSETFFDSKESRHEGSDGSLKTEIQGSNRMRRVETLRQSYKSHSALLGTSTLRVERPCRKVRGSYSTI